MKIPLHLATPLKDYLLKKGWEQIPVDRLSGVMKFKKLIINILGETSGRYQYIWIDRFFPDEDLTFKSSLVLWDDSKEICEWLTTQT